MYTSIIAVLKRNHWCYWLGRRHLEASMPCAELIPFGSASHDYEVVKVSDEVVSEVVSILALV